VDAAAWLERHSAVLADGRGHSLAELYAMAAGGTTAPPAPFAGAS
jgi:hypothetical protein